MSDSHEPPPQATSWLARDAWSRVVKLEREVARLSSLLIGADGTNGVRADTAELRAKVAALEALRFKALGAVAVIAGVSATVGAALARHYLGG